MAKKFITTRELKFIDSLNRELIQGVVQQNIIYYAISYEESRVHDVYDEAVLKEFLKPVFVNARVEFNQDATKTGNGTLDSSYSLSVSIHSKELEERNLKPREGDFIEFGQIVFEVTSVAVAQPVFGQINDKLMVKLTCVPSREGQFKVDSSIADGIDNTQPVNPKKPRTLGDDL